MDENRFNRSIIGVILFQIVSVFTIYLSVTNLKSIVIISILAVTMLLTFLFYNVLKGKGIKYIAFIFLGLIVINMCFIPLQNEKNTLWKLNRKNSTYLLELLEKDPEKYSTDYQFTLNFLQIYTQNKRIILNDWGILTEDIYRNHFLPKEIIVQSNLREIPYEKLKKVPNVDRINLKLKLGEEEANVVVIITDNWEKCDTIYALTNQEKTEIFYFPKQFIEGEVGNVDLR